MSLYSHVSFALYSYEVCSLQWKPRDASRWPEFRFAISTQKQRREHWQKATAPFSWCHFCLQLSFQNSCISAVRATDMLGNAQPCPRPWSRKTQEKFSCDSSAGCSLCSWSAGAQRGKLGGFLGTCALFPAFSSCSHHKTTCKSVQDQTREHPSGGGQGEASFRNNGNASPSTHARHGKGCSAAPSAWTRFSQGGTQTSRVTPSSRPPRASSIHIKALNADGSNDWGMDVPPVTGMPEVKGFRAFITPFCLSLKFN